MLDLLVFAAIAAAIVVAILALLKVMIEYPGMGDWCLRFIHRKTEKNSKISGSEESFEEIIVHDAARNHLNSTKLSELRCEKTEPTSSKSVSRTSTETEVFKRSFEEIDKILPAEQPGQSLQEIRGKYKLNRRHSSHDNGHRPHHSKHHHHHRRHSHSHLHHRQRRHHQHHHHHHHNQAQHHNHSSNTDVEYDNSPRKNRSQQVASSTDIEPASSVGTPERINKLASSTKNSSNMRININNVNILINRHIQNDVTINIDMDDAGEAEPEGEHHDEVRSSDSGIGWDYHDHQERLADHHDHDGHQEEPVCAETERNVIVEATSCEKQPEEENDLFKTESLPVNIPKRFRHNTYS